MRIRPATFADRAAMAAILNEIITIGGTTAYQEPLPETHFDRFINNPNPKLFLHVAETADGIQGMQWMVPLDPPDEDTGSIATFAKAGTTQRGIGSALFKTTRQASQAAGYRALVAQIRADNTGGIAYYAKMGFDPHEIIKDVPLNDGTPVDRVIRRLRLD